MGGSNGGGGFYPLDPYCGGNEGNSCLNLKIKTDLASVDPEVLSTVSVGVAYDVLAETERGPVYVSVKGKRLGTVLHQRDVQLLNCIFEGTVYQAKIISINGGKCQVKISVKQ